MEFLIVRKSSDSATLGTDVYVTGPHFGQGIYSSTKSAAEASRYDVDEATLLIDACRSWKSPRIVPAARAKDLA